MRSKDVVAVVARMLSAKGTMDMYITRTDNPARLNARDMRAKIKKDDSHPDSEGLIIERVFGEDAVELAPSIEEKAPREKNQRKLPRRKEHDLDVKV